MPKGKFSNLPTDKLRNLTVYLSESHADKVRSTIQSAIGSAVVVIAVIAFAVSWGGLDRPFDASPASVALTASVWLVLASPLILAILLAYNVMDVVRSSRTLSRAKRELAAREQQ